MGWMSNGRLFQTVGPVKEKDLSPKVCLWLAHEVLSCQEMSEAAERVCIYAVILTDTWDHFQKRSNDTEMRPCTESYVILAANEGNREQKWCEIAYGIQHLEFIDEILGCSCKQGVTIVKFWGNKSRNRHFGRITGKVLTNGGNVTQFYVGRCADIGDMLVHSKITVIAWIDG